MQFIFILTIFVAVVSAGDDRCKENSKFGLKHLATKSPYRIVANKDDSKIKYKGCEPLKIHGVFRHGTRTPKEKTSQKMKEKLNSIKDVLVSLHGDSSDSSEERNIGECVKFEKILKWNYHVEDDGEQILTHEGENEMIELAERFASRFPSILKRPYNNESFYFRFTDTQRTRESARNFALGLFDRKELNKVWFPEPIDPEPILRFYKLCPKWREEVKKSPKSTKELEEFKKSERITTALERISKELGLNYTLEYDDVFSMYSMCAFETSWSKKNKSPWCSVFDKDTYRAFEYGEELKYYWRDGYGFDINYKQACPLVHDIFTRFSSDDKPNSTFYFTHSGTILKLLAHLGLYQDQFKLMADTEEKQLKNRLWKTSFIDTFASNVVFILYKCDQDYKVLTMHQERIVRIPGCGDQDLCPMHLFKDVLFSTSINDCQFSEMCKLKS